MAVKRGCGERQKGAIYLCHDGSDGPNARPIEFFVCDPPAPIPDGIFPSPIGVQLIHDGVNDIWHVLDWVGSAHYPNVADFIEEVRRFGLSRRLSSMLDFSKLGPGSCIYLVHARARILNPGEYYQLGDPCGDELGTPAWCIKHELAPDAGVVSRDGGMIEVLRGVHEADVIHRNRDWTLPTTTMCAGIYWRDIEPGTAATIDIKDRSCTRDMPSFSYEGRCRPKVTPEYEPGIFMVLPAKRLEVIKDPDDPLTTDLRVDAASKSKLRVRLEDD